MAVVVALASFGWAMYQSSHEPVVAYFSTFTRTWELAAGALLAAVEPAVIKHASPVVLLRGHGKRVAVAKGRVTTNRSGRAVLRLDLSVREAARVHRASRGKAFARPPL